MKALLRTISLGLLLGGLQVGAGLASVVAAPAGQAVFPDYYSGLATGQGHRTHWATQYGAGTPQYTAAIESEYLQASRNLRTAREGGDANEESFWLGYIDGLERSAEEEA